MPQNPPAGSPRITPYLLYEDVDGAIDFLVAAFGFVDRGRMKGPEGKAVHASVTFSDGEVMMGNPGPDYRSPAHLGGATQLVYVYVDDVDKHYAAAKAAGARIITELADQFYGDRTYGAEDPEGHQWSFAQHVLDVAPEDMHP
jgi:uncharacterized glyoxalase superfamily protein PhnB